MPLTDKSPKERSEEISRQLNDLHYQRNLWEQAGGVHEIELTHTHSRYPSAPDPEMIPWVPLKEMAIENINSQIMTLQSEFATL